MAAEIIAVTQQKVASAKARLPCTSVPRSMKREARPRHRRRPSKHTGSLVERIRRQRHRHSVSGRQPGRSRWPDPSRDQEVHQRLRHHRRGLPAVDHRKVSGVVLLAASIAVIPTSSSPADYWSSVGLVKLIQQAQVMNEDLRAVFLLNKTEEAHADPRAQACARGTRLPVAENADPDPGSVQAGDGARSDRTADERSWRQAGRRRNSRMRRRNRRHAA